MSRINVEFGLGELVLGGGTCLACDYAASFPGIPYSPKYHHRSLLNTGLLNTVRSDLVNKKIKPDSLNHTIKAICFEGPTPICAEDSFLGVLSVLNYQ